MKIVILDGHAISPGDLSWDAIRGLGRLWFAYNIYYVSGILGGII
jgi:hypothetical protein